MCVLYTPGGVAGKQAPPATQTGFLYFNSHGKDSAVYACNRAESIKKHTFRTIRHIFRVNLVCMAEWKSSDYQGKNK